MGRPSGTKNNMRTPEEKEMWVLKYLNGKIGFRSGARTIGVVPEVFRTWIRKYKENGIEGLKSKTGKCAKKKAVGRPKKAKTREEELERENIKLKIEIERLKKGYYVKGVGQRKEYVSINNKNIKSLEN
ncbi:MAG: transposase [Bacilli bacterium]|nr:transposase [Bacilli bacterium]